MLHKEYVIKKKVNFYKFLATHSIMHCCILFNYNTI